MKTSGFKMWHKRVFLQIDEKHRALTSDEVARFASPNQRNDD